MNAPSGGASAHGGRALRRACLDGTAALPTVSRGRGGGWPNCDRMRCTRAATHCNTAQQVATWHSRLQHRISAAGEQAAAGCTAQERRAAADGVPRAHPCARERAGGFGARARAEGGGAQVCIRRRVLPRRMSPCSMQRDPCRVRCHGARYARCGVRGAERTADALRPSRSAKRVRKQHAP